MGGAQSQARSTGREVFSGNTNGGCGAMLTVTAGAKSSIMSDEPSTASISAGATKPATTAQVQSIANQEKRKKKEAALVISNVIRVIAVSSSMRFLRTVNYRSLT